MFLKNACAWRHGHVRILLALFLWAAASMAPGAWAKGASGKMVSLADVWQIPFEPLTIAVHLKAADRYLDEHVVKGAMTELKKAEADLHDLVLLTDRKSGDPLARAEDEIRSAENMIRDDNCEVARIYLQKAEGRLDEYWKAQDRSRAGAPRGPEAERGATGKLGKKQMDELNQAVSQLVSFLENGAAGEALYDFWHLMKRWYTPSGGLAGWF